MESNRGMPSQTLSNQGLYELQSHKEERLNVLTHGLGFLLSLLGLGLLLTATKDQGPGVRMVCWLYGLSLVQLFGVSTFYHACPSVQLKKKARILDHCAIYILIAGSYTPFMAITLNDWRGWAVLGAVWTLAILGVRYKLTSDSPFGAGSLVLYLCMGWLILLVWQPLVASLTGWGLGWLVAGGVIYSLGVPFYAWTSLKYSHSIWHLFVLAGAACQYVSVLFYVL